jgi:hypothetical protein
MFPDATSRAPLVAPPPQGTPSSPLPSREATPTAIETRAESPYKNPRVPAAIQEARASFARGVRSPLHQARPHRSNPCRTGVPPVIVPSRGPTAILQVPGTAPALGRTSTRPRGLS